MNIPINFALAFQQLQAVVNSV